MPGLYDKCNCKLCGKTISINRFEVCKECRKDKCKKCGQVTYSLKGDRLCASCRAKEQDRTKRLQGFAPQV